MKAGIKAGINSIESESFRVSVSSLPKFHTGTVVERAVLQDHTHEVRATVVSLAG